MATWTLTGTGLPIFSLGSNLVGTIQLVGAMPGDFNPDAITQVRLIRTMTFGGMADDTATEFRGGRVVNGSGSTIVNFSDGSVSGRSDGSYPWTSSDPLGGSPPTATGNYVEPDVLNPWWATYQANMKNDNGSLQIESLSVEIDYTPLATPVASFTADKTTVYTGQSIQFTDTSVNGPTGWSWDFDGGAAGSTQQSPLVTFNTPGVYNVVLTASNGAGSDPSTPLAITVLAREAEVWNGSAWVGGESWNGVAWVTPEVWDGTQWVPMKAP